MRLRFVDLFCGSGAASLGAASTGLFDIHCGVDADPEHLAVFGGNCPNAKLAKLSLPCEHATLFAQFPTEVPFHLHASPPTTTYVARGTRTESLELVEFSLKAALASAAASFSIEVSSSPAVAALFAQYPEVAVIELDAADVGCPAHRVRILAGSPPLIAALDLKRRQNRTYVSIRDAMNAAGLEVKGSHFRNASITPSAPLQDRIVGTFGVDERAKTLTTRLSLYWAPDPATVPSDEPFKTIGMTIEEALVVAGLPPTVHLGTSKTVGRVLVGAATPPCVLRALLDDYLKHIAIEEPVDDVIEIRESPTRKRARADSPDRQTTLLSYFQPPSAASCND